MKETWKNFDEYWKSVIERKVHVVSEIVMDPNARGNKLKLCKAVWEACAESYRCPQLEKKLEAAEKVVIHANKMFQKQYTSKEVHEWNYPSWEHTLRDLCEAYYAQMKDDSLGKKTEDTPQL